MAWTLVWSILQISVILMLTSISNQMSIVISNVHRTGPCRFDDCWPMHFRVCVGITTDVRTCSSTLDDCNNMSTCSDMRMDSENVQSLNLPPQNTSNKTAIGIYIYEEWMLMSTIDCRTPIPYDCRSIAASYSVNITQFSFQVTLTDLPGSSSAKPTTTSSTTTRNQPSSTTETLTTLSTLQPDTTVLPLANLTTSPQNTVNMNMTTPSISVTRSPWLSTTSNTSTSIGKSTRKEEEKTSITGVVVGSVVGVVSLVMSIIIAYRCYIYKSKGNAIKPGGTSHMGKDPEKQPVIEQEENQPVHMTDNHQNHLQENSVRLRYDESLTATEEPVPQPVQGTTQGSGQVDKAIANGSLAMKEENQPVHRTDNHQKHLQENSVRLIYDESLTATEEPVIQPVQGTSQGSGQVDKAIANGSLAMKTNAGETSQMRRDPEIQPGIKQDENQPVHRTDNHQKHLQETSVRLIYDESLTATEEPVTQSVQGTSQGSGQVDKAIANGSLAMKNVDDVSSPPSTSFDHPEKKRRKIKNRGEKGKKDTGRKYAADEHTRPTPPVSIDTPSSADNPEMDIIWTQPQTVQPQPTFNYTERKPWRTLEPQMEETLIDLNGETVTVPLHDI